MGHMKCEECGREDPKGKLKNPSVPEFQNIPVPLSEEPIRFRDKESRLDLLTMDYARHERRVLAGAVYLCRKCLRKPTCDLCGKRVNRVTLVPGSSKTFCGKCLKRTEG